MDDSRLVIERIIETDPVIKRGLQRRIINSRALARFIQESGGIKATSDAIVGVIRRYPLDREELGDTRRILNDCKVVMRSKVGDLALENGPGVMKRVSEFSGSIQSTKGENLRVVVGIKSVRVIADQRALEQFRQTFNDKEVVRYTDNLVEISLVLSPIAEQTKGVYARITTELALNNVNLVGIMCCSPESILIVTEKDAPKAVEVLQRMMPEDLPVQNPGETRSKMSLLPQKSPADPRKIKKLLSHTA